MESIFGKPRWAIFNARTGDVTPIEHLPFEIGSAEDVDLRLNSAGIAPKHCVINNVRDEGVAIFRKDPDAKVILDGAVIDHSALKASTEHVLEIGSERLLIHGARKVSEWVEKKRAEFTTSPQSSGPVAAETTAPGFRPNEWSLIDCQTGEITRIDKVPFEIGAAPDTDLHLEGLLQHHCAIAPMRGKGVGLVRREYEADLWLNGITVENEELKPDTDYTLQFGPYLFLLRGGGSLRKWEENLNLGEWFIYDPEKGFTEGPFPYLVDILMLARKPDFSDETIAFPNGMGAGFYLRQLRLLEVEFPGEEDATTTGAVLDVGGELIQPTREGGLICPVCWLEFDAGDIMHIAVHDSLRGDPVLGEDAPQRFLATRFNDRGQALDAFGLPCTEIACPHCRRAIPPSVLEGPQHILSIVGDQSAGKSYYLTVLIKTLPATLFNHYNTVFQDADPTGNAPAE